MFFREWVVPTVVLILTVVLNGCMMFSKEVKKELSGSPQWEEVKAIAEKVAS